MENHFLDRWVIWRIRATVLYAEDKTAHSRSGAMYRNGEVVGHGRNRITEDNWNPDRLDAGYPSNVNNTKQTIHDMTNNQPHLPGETCQLRDCPPV
jgi:hypothetical protein